MAKCSRTMNWVLTFYKTFVPEVKSITWQHESYRYFGIPHLFLISCFLLFLESKSTVRQDYNNNTFWLCLFHLAPFKMDLINKPTDINQVRPAIVFWLNFPNKKPWNPLHVNRKVSTDRHTKWKNVKSLSQWHNQQK